MKLGSVIKSNLALCIFLSTTEAGSLGAADAVKINEFTTVISRLHTRGGPDFVRRLDKSGATRILEALLSVSLGNLRRGYKCNLKNAGDFVRTLSTAELENIEACTVFTNVLDQFGKNVKKIPEACRNNYITELGKGKRRGATVGGIPASWAKKKCAKPLIGAIVSNGGDALAAICPHLMERFVKKGWHRYFPLDSLQHLSGPNKATLTPQWLEVTTGKNAVFQPESFSKALDVHSFHKILDQQLFALGALLDITRHFPPNIDMKTYLEALLVVTSLNLGHFVKSYNNYSRQWTRIFSVENVLLRNRERSYEDRCRDVDFICSCLAGHQEVGMFLVSTMRYIQKLSDDQITALGKLMHATIGISQDVAQLRHYIRRVLTPNHPILEDSFSVSPFSTRVPPQSSNATGQIPLEPPEKRICENFQSLIDQFLHSILSTFQLFEKFLLSFPGGDIQSESYGILRKPLIQILSRLTNYRVHQLQHASRDLALDYQRRILSAYAELIIKINHEAFKIRTMFPNAASKLSTTYHYGDPFTSPNLATRSPFVFYRIAPIRRAKMDRYLKIKCLNDPRVLGKPLNIDNLGEWVAKAHTCLRCGCGNPTFKFVSVRGRMINIAKSVMELVNVIDDIEDRSLRLCCLADLSTRLYQLAFDIEGFWSIAEDSTGAVYLDVSKFGLGGAGVKSAGNINNPAHGSKNGLEKSSSVEFNFTSMPGTQASPSSEESKQDASPVGISHLGGGSPREIQLISAMNQVALSDSE